MSKERENGGLNSLKDFKGIENVKIWIMGSVRNLPDLQSFTDSLIK